ncbi:MAG: hypothetical protein AAFU64_18465, partial [Bacteroidota bacterium]
KLFKISFCWRKGGVVFINTDSDNIKFRFIMVLWLKKFMKSGSVFLNKNTSVFSFIAQRD